MPSNPAGSSRRRLPALLLAVATGLAAGPAGAIEMFTFFGDGSRIGLPSLEVPIEAYPGIPLRSDRIRARRRAMRVGPTAAPVGNAPNLPRGITIRAMPQPEAGVPDAVAEVDEGDAAPPVAPEPVPPPPAAE